MFKLAWNNFKKKLEMRIFLRKILSFLSRFTYFTYLVLFHRMHKYMVRKYTKTCEIERMILTNNLKGLGFYFHCWFINWIIVFSIEHSKQLPVLTNYIRQKMNNAPLDARKLEELYYIKKIPMIQRSFLIARICSLFFFSKVGRS